MLNNSRSNKLIYLLKEICFLSIIFFTPLYFALFLKNNNVFELNKLVLFKILVLILLFLTILRHSRPAIRGINSGGNPGLTSIYFSIIQRLLNKFVRFNPESPIVVGDDKKRGIISLPETLRVSGYLLIPFLFLLVLFVATIFSINKEVSFYGLSNRLQGLTSYFYYFLFFILLLINIRLKEQINRIIIATVFSSFLVSVYGLIQAFGFDPLPWGESSKLRIFSTLGQPNLLSSYLLLTIPFCIYLILKNKKLLFKIIFFLILISQILCLFFTYSLSGWLGFIFGGFITTIIYFFLSFRSKRSGEPESRVSPNKHENYFILVWRSCGFFLDSCLRRNDKEKVFVSSNKAEERKSLIIGKSKKVFIIFVIILFIFIIGGFFIYRYTNARWTIDAKIESLTNFQSGSLASRLNFWEAAIKAIEKKPLLGYGPETQADSLIKYYLKDWGVTEDLNIRPDRAHNLLLDILLTSGIFGLLTYLALLYLFLKLIFKIIKRRSEFSGLAYFILFALLSYLIALQLNFTFVVGEIYFWLYLAIIIVIARTPHAAGDAAIPNYIDNQEDKNKIIAVKTNLTPTLSLLRRGGKILLILLFGIGISYLINNQIKLLKADYYFREMRESRSYNQYFSAIKMYEFIKEDIKKYGVYDRQFVGIMSPWLEEFANPGFKKYGEEKLAQILPLIKTDSFDDIYTRAKIYKALAGDKNKEYFSLAEAEYKKLISLSPELPNNYFELAGLYFKKADYEKAILVYQTELTKLPELTNPNLNPAHKQVIENEMYKIYTGIGDSFLELKKYTEAEKSYSYILSIDEEFYAVYASLASAYKAKGDLNKAIWYNEKGMEAEPNNYIWPLNLSEIYKEKGDTALYKEYLKKAQELAPEKF